MATLFVVRRTADCLTGHGRYTADVALDHTLHLAIVRSPFPAARIQNVDLAPARSISGFAAAWTAADLDGVPELPVMSVLEQQKGTTYPILAASEVRYVGEPVAAVVAGDRCAAEDAVQVVQVDYDPLHPVVDARRGTIRRPGGARFLGYECVPPSPHQDR